jgi:hypothetical protein
VTVVLVTWHDAHSGAESWINIKDLDTEPAEVAISRLPTRHIATEASPTM